MDALGGAILSLGLPCCLAQLCLTHCAALSCQYVQEMPCGEAEVLERRADHTNFHRLAQLGASLGATKHRTWESKQSGWLEKSRSQRLEASWDYCCRSEGEYATLKGAGDN